MPQLDARIKEIEEWLSKEFSLIRTGRATPVVLDGVRVDSYGTQQPIAHIANIMTENAKTIRIIPWDKAQIKDIEQAINKSELGLSVNVDNEGIRVIFPELTSERRELLFKLAKGKHEEARVSLRKARDEALNEFEKDEASEDDIFHHKEEVQKQVDAANKTFGEMLSKKETEISN